MADLAPRVVVLGAGGMLGHVAAVHLREVFSGSARFQARRPTGISQIDQDLAVLDAAETVPFLSWLDTMRPAVVVNCIGRKLSPTGTIPADLNFINSDLPRILADHLDARRDGGRLIQISSDGVFDGGKGDYTEADTPDANDPYGLSKIRGEIVHGPHLTIRTSMIGHALSAETGLLDWFLHAAGPVHGYSRCHWNGVTTLTLARFLEFTIRQATAGLVHLGGEKVSKCELLRRVGNVYQTETAVLDSPSPVRDLSLRSIRTDIEFKVPALAPMLAEYRDWYPAHVIRAA